MKTTRAVAGGSPLLRNDMTELKPLNTMHFFCPNCGITTADQCVCSMRYVAPATDRWQTFRKAGGVGLLLILAVLAVVLIFGPMIYGK